MEFLKELYNYNRALQFERVSDTIIFLLMVVGYFYIYQGKNELMKKVVVFPSIFYAIAVLNPISSYILAFKLGFAERMYRFLWIFPVALILGYVAIDLLEKISSFWKRWFLVIFFTVITFFTQGNSEMAYPTENIYKVTDELLEVTGELHKAKCESMVFFEDWNLYATVRQYDASIRVPMGEEWNRFSEEIDRAKENGGEEAKAFFEDISQTDVEFLVLYSDTKVFNENGEAFFQNNQHIELIAETEESKIYRFKDVKSKI